jgi:two-component system phosphate regulon sensor histidine kinase PhoR
VFDVWRHALTFLFFLSILSLFLWAVASALTAAIVFGALLMLRWLFHVRNLVKLGYWLENPETRNVPEGEGPWEDVFARLNKMVREHRKERTKRASALRDLELATSALPEGVVSLDKTDHIEWFNPLAEQHLGLDSSRDIGQQNLSGTAA